MDMTTRRAKKRAEKLRSRVIAKQKKNQPDIESEIISRLAEAQVLLFETPLDQTLMQILDAYDPELSRVFDVPAKHIKTALTEIATIKQACETLESDLTILARIHRISVD